MTESTITLQFPVKMSNEQTGFTYIEHDAIHLSVYARSLAGAKSKLRPVLQQTIDEALKQVTEYRQRFIATNRGEVLLVQYRNASWGYEIAGPDRQHTCGISGHESYEHACESARRHAGSSYDGIAWEI